MLLLLRIHALWGRRREIVIGTLTLYLLCYTCIGVVGLLAAIDIIRTSIRIRVSVLTFAYNNDISSSSPVRLLDEAMLGRP